ncbi:unnamed protein product, partial [Gulo gulo]
APQLPLGGGGCALRLSVNVANPPNPPSCRRGEAAGLPASVRSPEGPQSRKHLAWSGCTRRLVPVRLPPPRPRGELRQRNQAATRGRGNVLSRAARWTGSSAGSFLLFWCSLRLSSIAPPAALPLYRERRSWDPIRPLRCPCPGQAPPSQCSHSPRPGAGPGAPVGLRISLEALESSLAGAGVGVLPDGEVGLQPGKAGVGAEGQVPTGEQTACQPQCGATCFGKTQVPQPFNKRLSRASCVPKICHW